MNEIKSSVSAPVEQNPVVGRQAVTVAKPNPVVIAKSSGKELPTQETAATPIVAVTEKIQEKVEAAVAQMNEYIQSTQRDLHFSYDKASGETVVKVLDRSTQEVIRQIPDETFLKLAHSKDFEGNFQLFSAQA